ncbi:MAG: 3-hydroxyacyl-CoA dehydrogenase NAD-binding domain-containing protein [Planctomycetia bacterium]
MKAVLREYRTLVLERHADGIAVLRFFVPDHGQNVLTAGVVADLSAALDEIEAGPAPTGLIVTSGRPGSFFAGADIARLATLRDLPAPEIERLCAVGRSIFARLSSEPWPSVAVIDGICLGGGLELALACDMRLATDASHTLLGFPEVKLGLMPGWGGTVRLPRLIGIGPAVELAASGENLAGAAAAKLGLVDACVPEEQSFESACRLIESARATGLHLDRRQTQSAVIETDPDELAFLQATTMAVILGRSGGHYPAPASILRTIIEGSAVSAEQAAAIEGTAFAALARSPVSAQLVRVFQLGERNRHDPGLDDAHDIEPREIHSPAVIGAGIMGAGIAASHLRAGFDVALIDVQPEPLAASVEGILSEAAWDRAAKRADPVRALALAGRLRTATSLAAIAAADLVIESVVERTDIKKQVLAEIERAVGPEAVIATNTSTNPIAKLAEVLADPSRFCGIHFFNPVRRMTLVEVVRGPATSDATVATAVAHAKRLGKCPVVVKDSPGFLVNRILMPYLHEAVEMLREGVEMRRIDRVARAFGMPMGPIELYDMIGLDTAFYAGLVMASAFGDRIDASPVIPALVKSGRLGRKTGGGFYRYVISQGGDPQRARIDRPDADITGVIEPYALPDTRPGDATIADRLVVPMLLEAIRALDEGIVRDGRDIDLAVIHALGFPAFRGGLFAWADSLGAAEIVRRLEPLAPLGPRMIPTDHLLEMARTGGRFTSCG